jgi:hypothetical protein
LNIFLGHILNLKVTGRFSLLLLAATQLSNSAFDSDPMQFENRTVTSYSQMDASATAQADVSSAYFICPSPPGNRLIASSHCFLSALAGLVAVNVLGLVPYSVIYAEALLELARIASMISLADWLALDAKSNPVVLFTPDSNRPPMPSSPSVINNRDTNTSTIENPLWCFACELPLMLWYFLFMGFSKARAFSS